MKLVQQTAEAAQFEPYVAVCFLLYSNLAFITGVSAMKFIPLFQLLQYFALFNSV